MEAQTFGALLRAFPVAAYTTDPEGWITLFNEPAAVLWGRRPALGTERWCGSWRIYLQNGKPLPHERVPLARALRGEPPPQNPIGFIERPDGTRTFCRSTANIICDEADNVIGAVCVLIDLGPLGAEAGAQLNAAKSAHRMLPTGIETIAAPRLTVREDQVWQGIVAGQSTKVTARHLGISPRTVEIHRRNLMSKLEVRTVADLVRLSLGTRR